MQIQDVCQPLPAVVKTVLVNALLPSADGSYERKDVVLDQGIIALIEMPHSIREEEGVELIDCTNRMLLPGFVNAHSHSIEHWARGLIKPLPLELWLVNLFDHEPRGNQGWHGEDSFTQTPAWAVGLSALHSGVEALLSGCTAVMDHLFVRDLDDIEQTVNAYEALGMRSFVAPMLNDDANMNENYFPLVPDAKERNLAGGCSCGSALREDGCFREAKGFSDAGKTKEVLELYEAAVLRYHKPEKGVNIAIGPAAVHSCSMQLLKGSAELRKKYNLCGHIHLLETRAQSMMAKQFFPSGSAVKQLRESGFLDLPGTSCAHTVWLTEEEYEIMADAKAVCIHNPLSNLRLGSGVMPLTQAIDKNVLVAMGCDGACSSDGQDLLEALKLATTLSTLATPEYRQWLTPRHVALQLAAKNGYKAINTNGGAIEVGMVADVTLWDLTSLALLPRTDPLSLLILGSRSQAPGAGSTLDSVWIMGRKVVANGSPLGVNLEKLRNAIQNAQPEYRDPNITDPKAFPSVSCAEVEYRAAMGLDPDHRQQQISEEDIGSFPQGRVLYDSTIE